MQIKTTALFTAFLLLLTSFSSVTSGQESPHQLEREMRELSNASINLSNTNKNAPAFETLQQFHKVQEKYFRIYRDSSLKSITTQFNSARRERASQIDSREKEIAELKSVNDDIDRENVKMTRNSLLFFGILTGLAVIVLLNRFRSLAKVKEEMVVAQAHLKNMQAVAENRSLFTSRRTELAALYDNLRSQIKAAEPLLNEIASDKQHPLFKQVNKLNASIQQAGAVLAPEIQEGEQVPVKTDLNVLIDETADQAYHHMISEYPEFNCTIVRDLEKILPQVDVIPSRIRLVLFSLLANAFDSVRIKSSNAPKGYEPKVTLTSRKLPRFVQIRVKDNGVGISEKDTSVLFREFYTTKNSERNPGLGLSLSQQIIVNQHKGELLIESDPGTGSDFIIRFPVATYM